MPGESSIEFTARLLAWCSILNTIIGSNNLSSLVIVTLSPAQREEHSGPQGLVIQPGGVLVDGDLGVEQDGHPLGEARGGGPGTGGFISSLTWFDL